MYQARTVGSNGPLVITIPEYDPALGSGYRYIRTPIRFSVPGTDPALAYSADPDPVELSRSTKGYFAYVSK